MHLNIIFKKSFPLPPLSSQVFMSSGEPAVLKAGFEGRYKKTIIIIWE